MPRHFAPISVGDFRAKVEARYLDPGEGFKHREMRADLKADIKVKFDFENFGGADDLAFGPPSLLGYRQLAGGLTMLGLCAGGDWEHPVFFILYWDGKKIRGYVPTEGNPWNLTTKQAYGNDEDADLADARRRWPEAFKDAEEADAGGFDFDALAIQEDILARITPRPEKVKAPPERPTLAQRIEALTFYGCGDEAYELWQATCSLCYQMFGLGREVEAAILCGWAEEMAWASEKDWAEQGCDLGDMVDAEKGEWGR